MKEIRLNERQRMFAEEHHSVIEEFLNARRLPMDEFYDVVVFRFLRAVKQYDEREDLKQYAFSTIANNHMRSALGNHFNKERRQMDGITLLSLDYQFPDSNLTYGDIVADKSVNICDEVCEKLSRTPQKYRLSHTYSISPAVKQAVLKEVVCVQG